MRLKTSIWKRALSAFLCFVMLLALMPAFDIAPKAEAATGDGVNYISLPITIRDFAADGMLFEYNERGATGQTVSSGTPANAFFHTPTSNRCSWSWPGDSYTRYFATGDAQDYMTIAVNLTRDNSDFAVLRFRTSSKITGEYGGSNIPVIVQRNNSTKANKVGPHGDGYFAGPIVDKDAWNADHSVTWEDYFGQGQEWQYVFLKLRHDTATSDNWAGTKDSTVTHITIYPKLLQGEYFDFGGIWVFGSADNARAFIKNGYHAGGITYNNADTLGFGMLLTNEADSFNILKNSAAIGGSTFWNNGAWGDKTQPSAKNDTLNSGVTQKVQGAIIRSDLVYAELAPNGKPLYTRQAVCFLARYMQKVMKTRWAGANNTLNLGFVQGQELAQLGGTDLAERLRNRAQNDTTNYEFNTATSKAGISDEVNDMYTDAKARWLAGELDDYTDVHNWLDAAFYLLHNTWIDSSKDQKAAGSDGYGMRIDNYHTLNLVQKTSGGKTYYVFNSAYDKASYNAKTGVIQNTQTSTITGDKGEDGNVLYLRGNVLPKNRFDPLGKSYSNGVGVLGYGLSGDTTHDQLNQVAQWGSYYNTTNYNLSLEGHAKFIYYEDADQYFTFTGDDDVYLYINGMRVMDMGAAHSISKVTINLKDAAAKCGLVDGQIYDFDFFYMERHGTAANFGIETNIQIVDPAMTTTKTGYQYGTNTGYNGYVDPNEPVTYEFGLENKGNAPIQDLTFKDEKLGVNLTKTALNLGTETTMADLSLRHFAADGSLKSEIPIGQLTEAQLKSALATGLQVNEKILIYGFKHKILSGEWETRTVNGVTSNQYYYNQVDCTAISVVNNSSQRQLFGTSHWVVQKRKYNVKDYHVYEWMGHGVTLSKTELLQQFIDQNISGFDAAKATIVLSSASGSTTTSGINPKAKLNSNQSITYTSTKTGVDTFYYKVTSGTVTAVIGVAVYSYDVADNTYVLDYGLSVELNKDHGLMLNDTLNLVVNSHPTTASLFGISDATVTAQYVADGFTTGNALAKKYSPSGSAGSSRIGKTYGDFVHNGDSLKYIPLKIMDNTDTVTAYVRVLEEGATEFSKFTGVDMYQFVTTVPASVVYYEENFPGITYVESAENKWQHLETIDPSTGESVAGDEQSADQDMNYGSDPNYTTDKEGEMQESTTDQDGTLIDSTMGGVVEEDVLQLDTSNLDQVQADSIDALNKYLGLGGADSNGTVNQLVVKKTAEVMYFEFTGTGFEIISRTTAEDYAVINVEVYRVNTVTNDNGKTETNYTFATRKPVITESSGGTLYQIPIISITGLERAHYRVVVKAAGSTANKTRLFYVDGIRIYGPLSDSEALEYYNPSEYQAEIKEIKQLINDGLVVYSTFDSTTQTLAAGCTLIEDTSGASILTEIGKGEINKYMALGPNNELYIHGANGISLIAFALTPDPNTPEPARTIQIGAHRKSDDMSCDTSPIPLIYGSNHNSFLECTESNTYRVSSGTEIYYTIDPAKLEKHSSGSYIVLIGTDMHDLTFNALSLTNLKISGYTIHNIESVLTSAYETNTLNTQPIIQNIWAINRAYIASMLPKDEEVTEEDMLPVNENMTILFAGLRATDVYSGKYAVLTVKASATAETIVITDADGNEVTLDKCVRKVDGDVAIFSIMFNVTGNKGAALNYGIRCFDADGLASVNTESVTVTIK